MMFASLHDSAALAVIGANTTAILLAVGLVVFVLVLLFAGRKKGPAAESTESIETDSKPTVRGRVPASKEVFEPLPSPAAIKAEPEKANKSDKVVKSAPEDKDDKEEKGDEPWELLEEGEVPVKKPEPKARPEPAKTVTPLEKKVEAKAETKAEPRAEPLAPAKASPEAGVDAAAEAARLEEERRKKKADDERHAELARQAEARDKALKAEAEQKRKEAKALAEEQARERAEQKKKEAAARAEEEQKKRAEEEKKKAEAAKKQKAPVAKKDDAPIHKLEIPPKVTASAEDEPARTLKDGLGRTRKEGFIAKLGSLFAGKQLDQDLVDEVEEALFTADIGVRTADRLLQAVKDALSKKELKDADKVWDVLRAEAQKILEGAIGKPETQPRPGEPKVTMVLGVNGTGKTTSIGKLAHKLVGEGKKVTLVAGDTFRAAAAEQLEHWARRVNAVCIRGKEGADPASVVFDGVKQALDEKAEFVLVDTAGRLHNNVNLMEELKKVRRVMGRAIDGSPHEVLMVLDATTGQNGITQAKLFKEATDVTGIILTKLDGTAKGGVVLGVCDELKIPIRWIGVGERVSDLRPFDPKEFVDELFAPPA